MILDKSYKKYKINEYLIIISNYKVIKSIIRHDIKEVLNAGKEIHK